MKKTLYLFLIGISFFVLCQCESSNLTYEVQNNEISFPKSSEKFGKSIAYEIEHIIREMHKTGKSYSNIEDTHELKTAYYKDLMDMYPDLAITKTNCYSYLHDPKEFVKKISTLTEIQIEYIGRIIKECNTGTSYKDLYDNLLRINKDIKNHVPLIQQERLFNVTSFLYYSFRTIENLEKQGIFIPSQNKEKTELATKGIGVAGVCRQVIVSSWPAALLEPTIIGEAIILANLVCIAGAMVYELIICQTDRSYCQSLFENCVSDIDNGCAICLQFCLVNGYWPPKSTHRCYPQQPS